ncbi:hypothetical protein DERF_009600 [Dermatophagoides farinae]|uniref:Uncharacterized protein n=1 Tax=Dermatophagoides farinae TaxID=6954 RepID=A0A922HXM7_DERFA|nr:hypothetical protein DERF_009600 [Dermatophagoides farinae]
MPYLVGGIGGDDDPFVLAIFTTTITIQIECFSSHISTAIISQSLHDDDDDDDDGNDANQKKKKK